MFRYLIGGMKTKHPTHHTPPTMSIFTMLHIILHIDSLGMMKIVKLVGRHERKMITTVIEGCEKDDNRIEYPRYGNVRTSKIGSNDHWQQVREDVLYWMAVNGGYTDRCNPLMMKLVYVLVQNWNMKQPVCM